MGYVTTDKHYEQASVPVRLENLNEKGTCLRINTIVLIIGAYLLFSVLVMFDRTRPLGIKTDHSRNFLQVMNMVTVSIV